MSTARIIDGTAVGPASGDLDHHTEPNLLVCVRVRIRIRIRIRIRVHIRSPAI